MRDRDYIVSLFEVARTSNTASLNNAGLLSSVFPATNTLRRPTLWGKGSAARSRDAARWS